MTRPAPRANSPGVLLLRDAQRADLSSLARLAKVLDTVNLPYDERALAAIIDRSVRSFGGSIPGNENAHRQLMRLHALAGNRHLAIAQYRQCAEPHRELCKRPDAIEMQQTHP